MSNRLTRMLLPGVAIAAVIASSPAVAQEQPTEPTAPEAGDSEADETRPTAMHGSIDPFYGNLDPFHGTINPFYGDIGAFYGDINPFHGDIGAFWGDITAFYGDIGAFHGDIGAFYGDINPFAEWAPALPLIGEYWQGFGATWQGQESLWTDPLSGALLVARMNELILETETVWGSAVQSQTGQSAREAVLDPLFDRYGIDPSNPATMQALSAEQRARFFVDWYDSLMAFSGSDRVDHWMRTVNWTPAITQQQGSGADTIIGLLDATATGDPDIADNVAWSGGDTATVNGHGVGVASLMVAAHDRDGVMGIAPNATVIAYNPFDATNSASWGAVRTGILSLAERGASVINMSLGVAGYTLHPDWADIFFDPAVHAATDNRIFVVAAGNNGQVQTEDLAWNFALDPNLIIVGSVRMDGVISSFSNTPGDACLMNAGTCQEALMNRFMVAPGELILLPDGQGGFVRRSGTSFAAPIVSGAIALLHDRWPWLAQHPDESVDIMLLSARDLGAPGVDPVYGHGLLDVTASQSPLDYADLQFYEVKNGVMTARSIGELRATGARTTWESDGVYLHVYEPIGDTFRDFTVPMSSRLVGQVRTLTGAYEYFQRFAERGLTDWFNRPAGFSDMAMVDMPAVGRLRLGVSAARADAYLGARFTGVTPHTALRLSDAGDRFAFSIGYGNGAMALNGQQGLALSSDHSRDGGVNPLLALASGGAFANAEVPLGGGTTVSLGLTGQHLDHADFAAFRSARERADYHGLEPYRADAMSLRVTHRASPTLTLSGAFARIREHDALLGVQSRERSDLGGATSETATVAATFDAGGGFTLAASATVGRTRTDGDVEQGYLTRGGGVMTTAFAVSATRRGLLGRGDAMRLSLSQPLHIESGGFAYRSVEVIDRATGMLGLADQGFAAQGDARSLIGELLYETPILSGDGGLGFFGRAELQAEGEAEVNQFAVGTRLSVRF